MWADTLLILFISICTALLGEVGRNIDCGVWFGNLSAPRGWLLHDHIYFTGRDMGSGVQNREVPEAEVRDREAEQEAGEEEGGARGGGQPRQEQEEKAGGCKFLFLNWQFVVC